MSSNLTPDQVRQQMSQLWSMLDDLSENDQAAYRGFIEKNMKEGAEFMSPPHLHSTLCTQILEPKKGVLYVNICSWKRVPAPQDAGKPLPLYAGKLDTEGPTGDQGRYTVFDVALNPEVLQERKRDNMDVSEVYRLVLTFAQQQHGMKLSQQYNVVKKCPKSSPDDLYSRLGYHKWSNISTQPDRGGQTPASLLQQISSLQSEEQDSTAHIISRPAEHRKKDLIQVISTTSVEPQKPEYHLEVKNDAAGVPLSMELTMELPKVCSVSECQLSISKDDVLLQVEDVYNLLLEFPRTVNEDTACAIFNKKKRKLVLKVEIL